MTALRLDFSKLPDVASIYPELEAPGERDYAAHMKAREDAFQAIFGESEPPQQILSPEDPNLTVSWPGGGVYQFPPRGERRAFHYVTHGLSQPFGSDDKEDEDKGKAADVEPCSGMGIELVISTPERSEWPPSLLIQFVKYLLFNDKARLFVPGDRIPASLRTFDSASEVTHLFGVTSSEYPHEILLPAGSCTLVHLVGATAKEIERAKQLPGRTGTFVLAEVLRELGVGYVTDLRRRCATADPRFDALWAAAAKRSEAE
jgi:hypothetical protein